jgi:hypothetical protein
MMEAERISETSVYFNNKTRRSVPESCHPHTRRCENVNSHILKPRVRKRGEVEGAVRGLEGTHLADRCVLTKLQ